MEAQNPRVGIVNRAAMDDDQFVPGPQREAFMPRYYFTLRDDELDFELPITVYSEEPLGFELPEGAEPDEAQLEILIEAACSGGLDLPEVTDAFEEVRNCLFDYMTAGVGKWDDESARRLGRLIGLASYFDAGVNIWIEHWSSIAAHADSYAGLVYLEDGRDDGDIVAKLKSAFGDETLTLLRRIDAKTDIDTKSILDFEELRQFVQINEHDLRRFLREMLRSGTYPKSWRLGRRWKIPQAEKQRISADFWAWVVKNPSTKVERPAESGDSK